MNRTSVYRSAESRDHFRTRYQAFLDTMPFTQRRIDTPFGETFLLEAGGDDRPAVLLLHGSCSNSAFWFSDILALMGEYHVFAVDIPGEAGNSSEYRLGLETGEYALWLGSVLDALGLPAVSIAGNSLGGWMALKFATAFPARVEKLMLFASGGLANANERLLEQAAAADHSGSVDVLDSGAADGAVLPPEILEFLNLILESYAPIAVPLPLFSAGQLARLTMPVLYVAGTDDNLLDSLSGEAALRQSVPHAKTHLLPGVGHVIMNPSFWMLPFLRDA